MQGVNIVTHIVHMSKTHWKHTTDQNLIASYLKGESDALAELFQRYLQSIYNFSYRLVSNAADAEEITQETLLKVWRHLKKYDRKKSFRTWIFTIAHRTAIDWLRKKNPKVFSDFENENKENPIVDTLADSGPLPDILASRAGDRAWLEQAIAQLNPGDREILTLHYQNGLTFDEISAIVGKPLNTVKSQHRRALLKLRAWADAPKGPGRP